MSGHGLEYHDTWKVVDSTKLNDYMMCPRRYFYRYILGWRPDVPNNHLVFGQAWHLAMQHMLQYGYDKDSIVEAYNKFLAYYRTYFQENTDDQLSPKNPAKALEAMAKYAIYYKNDAFQVLYTEIAGVVPVGDSRVLHFKMDSILRDKDGKVFSLEHKTAKSFDRSWVDHWSNNVQTGTYNHALYCLFPEPEVWGVKINGVALFKGKQKTGDFAGDTVAFKRVPARRSYDMLHTWLLHINRWFDDLEMDLDELMNSASEDDHVLQCYKMNMQSCTDFFGCTYLDLCTSWTNPLQHLDEMPMGFIVEHWDPRKMEEDASVVVRGSEIVNKEVIANESIQP